MKDIHNAFWWMKMLSRVVLSGCQWTIWRIYTTRPRWVALRCRLFYQDVNEQIWRIYTTFVHISLLLIRLFCQDFNEQFEGYTQRHLSVSHCRRSCFIRMSMNNSAAKVQKILEICKFTGKYFDTSEKSTTFAATILKDIHNKDYSVV